ncbi:hypothetical protein predicted by Glimmer/Critica [Bdellovibrio bacteriovorus HD100]|uniref:Uncharacterized protein n=1 Tax=Bdellovibrio bacteriovorus (strain ATCC 15356 / DSM 50701 / NCIMB 9529 / HD100) TaxID=264462 RepID=Q6MH00_BDEBA|nr:hypothetical protein predicted by Glimmer/Critica [Bdellovibrio bacteriovorus HD100]
MFATFGHKKSPSSISLTGFGRLKLRNGNSED